MDVLLNEEEATIQEAAAAFLATESTAALVRAAERDPDRISRALWQGIAELGWLGIGLPEDCGGQGLPLAYLGLLFEELGRRLAPVPMLGTMVAALMLARHGDAAQRALVRRVVDGTSMLAVAVQEPDGNWSPDAIALSGRLEGDTLVLRGEKAFIEGFRVAERCVLAYRSEEGALALALVDPGAPGITVSDLVTTAGDAQATARFDGVRIPAADRIAPSASGRAMVVEMMDLLAAFTTALMVGAAAEATHRAVEYAKQRNAFGQPIGAFQAIQHMAADMTIGVDGAQLLVREAIFRLGHGLAARVEVAQAKAFASEKCLAAVRMAQQIHGGIGFIAEYDQQLWYRRVVSWSLRSGTAPEHRRLVAESLLDRQGPVRLGYDQSLETEPA